MVTTFDGVALGENGTGVDDDEEFVVEINMTPAKGVPKVDPAKRTRKEYMPDGEHWIDVRGGGSSAERAWVQRIAEKHDEMMKTDALGAHLWTLRRYGTFLAARMAGHNLVDKTGDPLPRNPMELVHALSFLEAMALVNRVNNATAIFADPKAERLSSGGMRPAD